MSLIEQVDGENYSVNKYIFSKKLAIFQHLTKVGCCLLTESIEAIWKLFQRQIIHPPHRHLCWAGFVILMLCHHETILTGNFHRKGYLMLHHIAGTTWYRLQKLVIYNYHPLWGWWMIIMSNGKKKRWKISSRCYTIANTRFITFDIGLGTKVTQNVAHVTQYYLHHVTYALAKFEVFMRCITSFDLWPWQVSRNESSWKNKPSQRWFATTKINNLVQCVKNGLIISIQLWGHKFKPQ